VKLVILIALTMVSTLCLAHSGHSESNVMLHDAEHIMWILSGAALLATVVGLWILKKR